MSYDVLIKGGRIYDGSGLPSFLGDVAVKDGRIVETGRINGSADRVVNADGLAVSPGFIDFHTHLDAQLLWDPIASSSCFHGITTVIPGNCALALAPCKEQDHDSILRSFERVEAISLPALRAGVPWGWTTFPQYLDRLRGNLEILHLEAAGGVEQQHHDFGIIDCALGVGHGKPLELVLDLCAFP